MYAKYRVTALCKHGREIGTHVYDGTPEQVIAEMHAYLLSRGIYASGFETDIVTYDISPIR